MGNSTVNTGLKKFHLENCFFPRPLHYVSLKNPVEPGPALFRTKCNKQEGIYRRALRLNKEVAGFYGSSRRRWTVGWKTLAVCAALTTRTTLNQWPAVTITLTSNLRHPALGSWMVLWAAGIMMTTPNVNPRWQKRLIYKKTNLLA